MGLALTDKEQAQCLLHRLNSGRGICNIAFALRASHPLRWWPLQEALNHIARRHPAMRAVFRSDGAQWHKVFLPPGEITVPVHTVAGDPDALERQLSELAVVPFDLDAAPLMRAHVLTVPDGGVLCVVLHHLVGDMVTAQVVLGELTRLYDAFAAGTPVPAELRDATELYVEPEPNAEVTAYWQRHLAGVDPATLTLAGAKRVPAKPSFAGDRVDLTLSEPARAAIDRLRKRFRVTGNLVLLAAYFLLLARHGAGPDLVVGMPTNTRRGNAATAVGYHVNVLPLRVAVDLRAGFAALAGAVRDAFAGGLEHATASFESLRFNLDLKSVDWRAPLFRHSFNVRPVVVGEEHRIAGDRLEQLDASSGLSRLDLELVVRSSPTSTTLQAEFSTEVHDPADIATFLARFERLLLALDAAPEAPVGALDPRTDADRDLVATTNATARDWPGGTVLDEVLARAAVAPEATAIEEWSYRRLVAAAGGVRDELVRRGVRPGDVVALRCARGPLLAAAALGVWGTGAAYLPLDPQHPNDRLAYQIADAEASVVLTDDELSGLPEGNTDGFAAGELAWVIYTSGSTGKPKGVEVSHPNAANLVRHFVELLQVTAGQKMLWLTTFSFDISALELFVPLVAGAAVVVASDSDRLDPTTLLKLMAGVDVVQATPTTWRHLAGSLDGHLRGLRVLSGGEPLPPALAERLLADGCRLFNVYGPTETTIWSTATELRSPVPERVPIGLPIANTAVYVLDGDGAEVPPGVPGELCVGGAGVAVGYRGAPGLTSDRFVDDPRLGRHYRTGDQARQLPGGQLEFCGRTDRQVKVLGHRIELGEVEAALAEHPAVQAAAVIADTDPSGHVRLFAAVELATGADNPTETLRDHALTRLAGPTVPSGFVVVEAIPVTGNGKTDYKALARLVSDVDAGPAPELPADPTLRQVVELWRAVLSDGRLSPESNFFLHGGHSLLAALLAEKLTAVFGHQIEFDLVYEAPTPVQMAARLGELP